MASENPNKLNPTELGFGTFTTSNNQRILDKDGSSNIQKMGLPYWRPYEIYQKLIVMSWSKFLLMVFVAFVVANLFFAQLYVLVGVEHLKGAVAGSYWKGYWEAFFFSAQTMSTVGYGRISPEGYETSALSAFESLIGLLILALATGLLYGRFSRPELKLIFSKEALIAPFLAGKGLMFKIANLRNSDLLDVIVEVVISKNEQTMGKFSRKFYPVTLERNRISILSMTWTIVHPIDQDSPIFGLTYEELAAANMEVLVLIKGFDPTFSQTVHSRSSYMYHEIVFDARFKPTIGNDAEGRILVDLSQISRYESIAEISPLPDS
jgi:inward rectifier potassium channel